MIKLVAGLTKPGAGARDRVHTGTFKGRAVSSARLHLHASTESSRPALCEHHEEVVLVDERFCYEDSRLTPEIGERKLLGGNIGARHGRVGDVAEGLARPAPDFQACVRHPISQMAELGEEAR